VVAPLAPAVAHPGGVELRAGAIILAAGMVSILGVVVCVLVLASTAEHPSTLCADIVEMRAPTVLGAAREHYFPALERFLLMAVIAMPTHAYIVIQVCVCERENACIHTIHTHIHCNYLHQL
jgi:hypothetical protein